MDPFENAKKMIEKISTEMRLSGGEKELLLSFERIGKAEINLGEKTFPAWRIVHNNALGPGKGGIRYHPNVSEEEVKALSFWMSIKNSLAGLPYGGAKGGIRFNPKEFSEKELEEISRKYIRAFHENLGQDKDIPAPDVYTNAEIMGWMLNEFEKITGRKEPAMITGKPLSLGGCPIRETATSKGGSIVLEQLMKELGMKAEKTSVAVQGFGNAGSFIAKMCYADGFKVIAVSDSKGGIVSKKGLAIPKVMEVKQKTGAVNQLKGVEKISNEELLELDADVLVLAALENVITEKNAGKIKAKYILELANGPVTPGADEILFKKDIIVVPDILANAGGVVASYMEWVQNKTGNSFEVVALEKKLEERMVNSFQKVYKLSKEKKIDTRTAAYIIAIERILEAEMARGRLSKE